MPAFGQMPRRMMMAGAPMMGAQPLQQELPRTQTDPLGQGLRPRMGMFGRLGNALTQGGKRSWGDVLGIVGAGLQQMDGGTELTDYLAAQEASQREQMAFDENMRRRKGDEESARMEQESAMAEAEREAAQRQQLEAYIAGLPQDQQLLARLNPQAYVAGIMRHRYPAPRSASSANEPYNDPDLEPF